MYFDSWEMGREAVCAVTSFRSYVEYWKLLFEGIDINMNYFCSQ